MNEADIDALLQTAWKRLDEARDAGTKVVGYFPGGCVPEELLYASGAISVCLANGGDARIADEALSILPNVICPFARAQVGQMLLKVNPFYTSLDLLVVPSTCQHMKKIGDVWEYYDGCSVFKLGVPYEHDKPFELEYFQSRLLSLKQRLELLTGNTVTDDKLYDAIELYNRLRRLLKTLSLARRGPGPHLTTLDFERLNHASLYVDPVVMVDILEATHERQLNIDRSSSGATPDGIRPTSTSRPRLLLAGPNLAIGDYDLIRLISDAGAEVVIEDVFEGMRDYWHTVDPAGDPIEALARGYLVDKRPAAFMRRSLRPRLEFMLSLIRDFNIMGVVWYQLACCEFYDQDAYFFQNALLEHNIPMLVVESDYHSLDCGPVRTRLDAFIETLVGGLIDG
jgi:benzoyl-CoA reductase/2-hydroxyglutaryl-CoA dehydratase subunit BcrC/BadD/HgdB